jgi:hypothetical protein
MKFLFDQIQSLCFKFNHSNIPISYFSTFQYNFIDPLNFNHIFILFINSIINVIH